MPKYQYRSFARYIRLLELSAGTGDRLRGRLIDKSLDDPGSYEAVSYVWGIDNERRQLETPDGTIPITPNAYSALKRLRKPRRSIYLWIDSVCIDQTNKLEKSHQVRLMAEIYQKASKILVYLGEEADASHLVPALMKKILAANLDKASTTITPDCYGLPPLEEKSWTALGEFLNRPWFTRTWVIQEFILNRTVRMVCGGWEIRGEVLVGAVTKIAKYDTWVRHNDWGARTGFVGGLERAKMRYLEGDRPRLPVLLNMFRCTEVMQPEDRLFALLSLARDGDHQDLAPDYEESLEKICQNYTRHFVKSDHPLEILSLAGLRSEPPGCLSWTLNPLSLQGGGLVLGIGPAVEMGVYNAGSDIKATTYLNPEGDVLTLEGVLVDVVSTASVDDTPKDLIKTLNESRQFMSELAKTRKPYPTGETLDVVEARTLIVNSPWQYNEKEEVAFDAWLKVLGLMARKFMPDPSDDPINASRPYAVASIDATKGRKCCLTESGYFGMVPLNTRKGDKVFIPCGGSVPFIIRASDEREGTYLLIGECYIHGIMSGEAIDSDQFPKEQIQFH